jgi:uncharacterized protein YdhG (YjbR/CyaY superfamily)
VQPNTRCTLPRRRRGSWIGDQITFLFAFSAHEAHLNFTPNAEGLEPFRKELEKQKTTKGSLQIPYNKPLPEDLVRKIAEYRLRVVREREDDAFS